MTSDRKIRRRPAAQGAKLAGRISGDSTVAYAWAYAQAVESLTGTNLFNPEVYFLSRLPAVLRWQEVGQVVGMALFLSLLATLYPSWRAARTDPVEALRHE